MGCLSSGEVTSGGSHLLSSTAITEVFGDGQKITALALEYDAPIDGDSLDLSDYTVKNGEVTRIYTNSSAAVSPDGMEGNYLILELYVDTLMVPTMGGMGGGPGMAPGAGGEGGPQGGPMNFGSTDEEYVPLSAVFAQTGDIATKRGAVYTANGEDITTDSTINLIVDDFEQYIFTDPNYGDQTLMYSLYVPENYDPAKSYPLVLFMPDASATSSIPTKGITQGLGAVIWASDEEQAKHEAFVLSPQFASSPIQDNAYTDTVDMVADLVNKIASTYSIDRDRMYTTGQSGGCMVSLVLDIKYPDLFAASFLVAGQWDAAQVAPMANDKLWIVVCEGDTKAYPGMNAITAALEEEGAAISRAIWDPTSSEEEFAGLVAAQEGEGTPINYTVFEGGDHMYTWKVAYSIEGIRDWLFSQSK